MHSLCVNGKLAQPISGVLANSVGRRILWTGISAIICPGEIPVEHSLAWRNWQAHLSCKQDVVGSNPTVSFRRALA